MLQPLSHRWRFRYPLHVPGAGRRSRSLIPRIDTAARRACRERVQSLYHQGMAPAQIAAELRVPASTVYAALVPLLRIGRF